MARRYSFTDGRERSMCAAHRTVLPTEFPVQNRGEIAVAPLRVVAERPNALLLCNGLHPGPHVWPAGEEVDAP